MRKRFRSSIAFKLALFVLCGSVAVFSIVLLYSYVYSRQIILDEAKGKAMNLALAMSRKIEQQFIAVGKLSKSLAGFLESSAFDQKTLFSVMKRMVSDNSEIYGMAVAFQPYAFDGKTQAYAPYFYKTGQGLQFCELGDSKYNYFQQDWFHIPIELRAPVPSEPYFDEGGGNILMVTYSFPFFYNSDDEKRMDVRGVATADVDLAWLSKLIEDMNESRKGFSFVITDTGVFVSYPIFYYVMKESLFSLAESRHDPRLRTIGRQILHSNDGFLDAGTSFSPEDSFLAYSKILSTGWTFASIFPKDELFAEVYRLHRANFLLSLVGIGLLALLSVLVARSIARPLKQMAMATKKIAVGDLNIELDAVHRTDEVGVLAQSFTQMADGLKERDFIRDAFGRYVTQEVVNRLLKSHDGLKLGGEIREISMMMSDIRGFTALTANMKPEDIITLLNRYLGEMVDILLDFRGIIDEIIGDGILSFFGAPEPLEDHPERAVACALKMQQAMAEINTRNMVDGLPRLEMGIAVNTGSVVVGNIGSDKRVKYGAVGPDVNFTGRMESFSVGGQVLVSQSTYERLSSILVVKNILEVEMKGFEHKVKLYDVIGIRGKYSIALKDREEIFRSLATPIIITYFELSRKTVSSRGTLGTLREVSQREAKIVCSEPVALWENIKIILHDEKGEISKAVIYAKVISVEKIHDIYHVRVHFTSVSPQAVNILEKTV
ncbi:MAG: adenylate/guanylate cyclase domain-containing protein [Desulfomonilaceae bacterium]